MDLLCTTQVTKPGKEYSLDIFQTDDKDMDEFNETVVGNIVEIPCINIDKLVDNHNNCGKQIILSQTSVDYKLCYFKVKLAQDESDQSLYYWLHKITNKKISSIMKSKVKPIASIGPHYLFSDKGEIINVPERNEHNDDNEIQVSFNFDKFIL